MEKLGFIGTGHMTGTMVRHLAPKGHRVAVTERGREVSAALSRAFENVHVGTPQDVIDTSDVVFLCLRPQIAEDVLKTLTFRKDQKVVSVMAGLSHAALAEWVAPASEIMLMLPMELIEKGGCPIAAWPDAPLLRSLFEPENTVISLESEDALAACFAATTLVSAVAETADVGAHWLGAQIGERQAQVFVGQLIEGMLGVHAHEAARFATLRDSLATPGTLNLAMVEAVRAIGLPETLRAKLDDLAQ